MDDNIPTQALHALSRQIPAHDTTSVKIYEKAYKWSLVIDPKFTPKWVRNITLVQIDRASFSKGLNKSSFKMRDVTQPDTVFVAKFGANNYLSRNTFFNVAIVQSICEKMAEKFNASGDFPIKLKFQPVFVLELVEKMHPHNVCSCESFIDGDYTARGVSTNPEDAEFKIFQAFNHFIISKTNHEFSLSHFQIVQNLLTGVQIHTKSGKGFSDHNQGQQEFLRFAGIHTCNEFCHTLNLPPIDVAKIQEAPPQPKMPNGVAIRKTVAAAATEKVVSQGASFVSQKRAVFLQHTDNHPPNPAPIPFALPQAPSPPPTLPSPATPPPASPPPASPPPVSTPPATTTPPPATTAAPVSVQQAVATAAATVPTIAAPAPTPSPSPTPATTPASTSSAPSTSSTSSSSTTTSAPSTSSSTASTSSSATPSTSSSSTSTSANPTPPTPRRYSPSSSPKVTAAKPSPQPSPQVPSTTPVASSIPPSASPAASHAQATQSPATQAHVGWALPSQAANPDTQTAKRNTTQAEKSAQETQKSPVVPLFPIFQVHVPDMKKEPDDDEDPEIQDIVQYEEIAYEIADELTEGDYDAYSDDEEYYYEEYEPKPLPPLPDKSPFAPCLRRPDHTYASKSNRVRWFDLIDFERNLLNVHQARKGGGEGIVLAPEPPRPPPEQVKQWDLKSFKISSEPKGAQAECFIGDENPFIYTGSSEGHIAIWDVPSLKVLSSFKAHTKAIKSLVLRDVVLYSGSADTNIASWDIHTKKSINKTSSKAEINALSLSVAHNLLFSAENDKTIKVWDLHSLQYVTTLNGHTRAVKALYVMGNYLFSGSNDQQVFVWNLNTQRVVKGLLGHEGWIRSIHALGSTLYTGSQDETIRLWDLNSTECFQVIQAKGPVQSLVPTQQCLFSAAGDYVEVWNNDYQCATVLNNKSPVLSMWHREGQLFCGSIANSLKVWTCD